MSLRFLLTLKMGHRGKKVEKHCSTVLGTNMTNSRSLDHDLILLNGRPSIHQYIHRRHCRTFKLGRYLNQNRTPIVNGLYRNMLKHTAVVDENPNVSAKMATADPVRYTYAKNISDQYARRSQLGVLANSRRARAFLKRNPLRSLTLRSADINSSGLPRT